MSALRRADRLFILGAGASAFAGFPIGATLWNFLVDHCEGETGAFEWIDAYLSRLPLSQRVAESTDLELMLTKCESGELPSFPALRTTADSPQFEDRISFFASRHHLMANQKGINLDEFYKGRLVRRSSKIVHWQTGTGLRSIDSFVRQVTDAFFHHHACIRFRGRHHAASPDPGPANFFQHRCPCYHRCNLRRLPSVESAIAKSFRAGDIVVTFNWDCLLESILWNCGKWSLGDGYGFQPEIHRTRRRELSTTMRRIGRPSPVTILKGHGSINWAKNHENSSVGINYLGLLFGLSAYSTYLPDRDGVFSSERGLLMAEDGIMSDPDWPFTRQTLLAPTYLKTYDGEPTLAVVWDKILDAVKGAREITVIGYSLPPGDLAAREFLAHAIRTNRRCRKVTVVGPKTSRRSHWAEFLALAGKPMSLVEAPFEEWVANS